MKRYQEKFNVDAIRPCSNYKRNTGECLTGCPKNSIQKGDACPYQVEVYDSSDELQTECLCYK